MSVSRHVLTRGRQVAPGEVLEKIDSGDRIAMQVREENMLGVRSFTGNIPFWQVNLLNVEAPDMADPEAEPLVVAEMGDMRLKVSRRKEEMPYTWRSTVHDELHFVHSGTATFRTELGEIQGLPGRFIFIGRGIRYRIRPESGSFFDLILESGPPLGISEHWASEQLKSTQPVLSPASASKREGDVWEERIKGHGWAGVLVRDRDPLDAKEVVGPQDLVFAVDMKDIPVEVHGTHRPFRLFSSDLLELDISKQGEGEGPPFQHRNNIRNEVHFVHSGDADQLTELGYIDAPAGTLLCMPFGIQHTFGRRETAPCTLLFETKGGVELLVK